MSVGVHAVSILGEPVEDRRNLSIDPISNPGNAVGWYPNDSTWTREVGVPITGHPDGIATAVRSGPIGAAVGTNTLTSLYSVDGLGDSATERGLGLWMRVPYPCQVEAFVGFGTTRVTQVPPNVWTFVNGGTPSHGYAIVSVYRTDGVTAAGDTGLFTGSIAEAGLVPPDYFDGNSPDTIGTDYAWAGAPGASESIRTSSLGTDLSCLVDSVSIVHGRDDPGSQPEASAATIELTATPEEPLPPEVEIGAGVLVTTTTPSGVSTRFVGRITDLLLGWEEAGTETPDNGVGQIVAVGPLADLGRRVVGDVPWPVELDGARVARVMSAAGAPLDPATSDPGRVDLVARDVDSQPALDLARAAAESASGVLYETRDGAVRYADSEHRRGLPSSLSLDACDLLVSPSWRRNIEGLVNEVSIGYGVEPPEGGEQPRYTATAPESVARWGRYGYTSATELATLSDAQAMGNLLLARNSSPVWVMADLPVDVLGLDAARYEALLGLDLHALVTLTGLPAIGTAPSAASLWVEGYHETLTYGGHEIALVVSGYCRTSPPPRWDDLAPEWLWDDLAPSLTWDSVACLGPPINIGRWADQPATLRWDALAPSVTWDNYPPIGA